MQIPSNDAERFLKLFWKGKLIYHFAITSNIFLSLTISLSTQVCPALWASSVHVFSIHNSLAALLLLMNSAKKPMELVKAVDLVPGTFIGKELKSKNELEPL